MANLTTKVTRAAQIADELSGLLSDIQRALPWDAAETALPELNAALDTLNETLENFTFPGSVRDDDGDEGGDAWSGGFADNH
jgi:hypothetical protein